MKMNKTAIIGIAGFSVLVLALGVFLNLKEGRDIRLVKLEEEIKEDMEISLTKDIAPEPQSFTQTAEKQEVEDKGVVKAKKSSSSSYSSYYVKSEPQYIENLKRAGIEVKKREEMTSVGKLVSRHMEKEGFPKMEESFAKELPDNYVSGQVIVKRAIYRDNGEYEVAYDTIEVGEGQELLAIAKLEEEDDIISAEPNVEIEFETALPSSAIAAQGIPAEDTGSASGALSVQGKDVGDSDPDYVLQWGLEKIEALDAWEIEKGKDTVNIAIIDTGCDLNHIDLTANIDGDESYDYVNNDAEPDDNHGHGTHVAGIIAAVGDNDIGGNGVMWNSNLIILKVLDEEGALEASVTSDAQRLADAISDAIVDKDAKIINMSCGTTTDLMGISTLKDAFEAAFAEDVLIVAAAGNDENEGVLYPAKYEGVLSVGATDKNDQRSVGTAYGAEVDIAAPGEGIYSTEADDSYGYQTGTSMSAAFVSGVAGLLLSKDLSLNKLQLKAFLTGNADAIADSGMGTGRLNAKKALDALEAGVGDVVAVAYVGESGQTEITVETGEEVQFYGDESTSEGELAYQWDFGGGKTSDEKNPVHTYTEEGDYDAILVVSAGDDYTPDTDSVNVTVEEEDLDDEDNNEEVPDDEIWVAGKVTIGGELAGPILKSLSNTVIFYFYEMKSKDPLRYDDPIRIVCQVNDDGSYLVKFTGRDKNASYKIVGFVPSNAGCATYRCSSHATIDNPDVCTLGIRRTVTKEAEAGSEYTKDFPVSKDVICCKIITYIKLQHEISLCNNSKALYDSRCSDMAGMQRRAAGLDPVYHELMKRKQGAGCSIPQYRDGNNGDECSSQNECNSGLYCENSRCHQKKGERNLCTFGFECFSNNCVRNRCSKVNSSGSGGRGSSDECHTQADCDGGFYCLHKTCNKKLVKDSKCYMNLMCESGKCDKEGSKKCVE